MCVCTKGNFSAHRCTEIDTSDFDAVHADPVSDQLLIQLGCEITKIWLGYGIWFWISQQVLFCANMMYHQQSWSSSSCICIFPSLTLAIRAAASNGDLNIMQKLGSRHGAWQQIYAEVRFSGRESRSHDHFIRTELTEPGSNAHTVTLGIFSSEPVYTYIYLYIHIYTAGHILHSARRR